MSNRPFKKGISKNGILLDKNSLKILEKFASDFNGYLTFFIHLNLFFHCIFIEVNPPMNMALI